MTPSAVPPHPPGAVRLESADGGQVLHLLGEVDAGTVASWDRERRTVGPQGAVVAVDASGATFLSSAGVAMLLRETETHRAAGGRPQLRSPSRAVLQVLRLTGMVELFDVVAG